MSVPPAAETRLDSPLADQVRGVFRQRYGELPRLFRAPGRVNLIGEHTDYNEGFVLPLAIERSTFVAASPRADRRVEVQSLNLGARAHFDLDGPRPEPGGHWSAYVAGVARVLDERGLKLRGANLVLVSEVPPGAGLSSSAALEMAVGLALLSVSGYEEPDRVQLALAGQQAEHDYVGTRCGIMDQYVSALAQADHALLVDCRSLQAQQIPLALPGHVLLVLDTGVRHELAASEYNQRRAECEEGVRLLRRSAPGVRALRDVTPDLLSEHGQELPGRVWARCRHVVSENARTLEAAEALRRGDLAEVGRLMAASHQSLRDDYEVSCAELDALVEISSRQEGVVGARMTGAGFGGSTVNLVRRDALEPALRAIRAEYAGRFHQEPGVLVTRAAAGAAELT